TRKRNTRVRDPLAVTVVCMSCHKRLRFGNALKRTRARRRDDDRLLAKSDNRRLDVVLRAVLLCSAIKALQRGTQKRVAVGRAACRPSDLSPRTAAERVYDA